MNKQRYNFELRIQAVVNYRTTRYMSIIPKLDHKYTKSLKYFEIFYNENYSKQFSYETFKTLDFYFQFGLFIEFFNSVNTDIDIYSNEKEALQDSILEAFATYEEYLFLDS